MEKHKKGSNSTAKRRYYNNMHGMKRRKKLLKKGSQKKSFSHIDFLVAFSHTFFFSFFYICCFFMLFYIIFCVLLFPCAGNIIYVYIFFRWFVVFMCHTASSNARASQDAVCLSSSGFLFLVLGFVCSVIASIFQMCTQKKPQIILVVLHNAFDCKIR